MSYNNQSLPHYMKAAGKVSIFAAVTGLAVFMFAFMVDIGQQEIQRVSANVATTSLTVLNTPPQFTVFPYEVTPSSDITPTNSGDRVRWEAVGTDSNNAPYFLLVCSTNASPTAGFAANNSSLGTVAPSCGAGAIRWAVSTSTVSGQLAFAATTTSEAIAAQFAEENQWFAWVCDDDPTQPACNQVPSQGLYATSSSPFNMNRRPVLTSASNDGPVDPAALLSFLSVSSDPDSVGGEDDIRIVVCQSANYSTSTNACITNPLASTSISITDNATATTTMPAIIRDGVFPAFVYLVDQHGHESLVNGLSTPFTVNNVAPTVTGGNIVLNNGTDITLSVPGGQTTGFSLDFTVNDANSCLTAASTSEITGYELSVFRTSYGTTTCNPNSASYNPNFCYPSKSATTTWNLACTASTTSCTGPTDDSVVFNCSFPMWFLADPTDAGPNTPAAFAADSWSAAVAGADNNFATSSLVIGNIPVQLISAPYIDLLTAVIPYGALAPGNNTGTLSTSTVILNIGNTGIDQGVDGSAMCPGFVSSSTNCSLNGTSTIFTTNQRFSSTTLSYVSPLAVNLPTTTIAIPAEVELDVLKTTSTSTPAIGTTWWGIAVPSAVTVAGSYTGLNTFYGYTAEAADWQ